MGRAVSRGVVCLLRHAARDPPVSSPVSSRPRRDPADSHGGVFPSLSGGRGKILCEPGIVLGLFRMVVFLCPPFFGLLFLSSTPIQSTQKIPEHLGECKENCLESALQKTLAVRRKREVMIGVMAKWNISSTFKEALFFP